MGLATKDLSRSLTTKEQDNIAHLDKLKYFLATAPSRWSSPGSSRFPDDSSGDSATVTQASSHPSMNRFLIPSSEYVSCVLWSGTYHITGTDIVRALVFRFEAFGRPVRNMKKFEEGVFSDLRNLKPGVDATLEEPKVHDSCHNNFLDIHIPTHVCPVAVLGPSLQVPMYSYPEKAKSVLLVSEMTRVLPILSHFMDLQVFCPT